MTYLLLFAAIAWNTPNSTIPENHRFDFKLESQSPEPAGPRSLATDATWYTWPITQRINPWVSVRQCPLGGCTHGDPCPHKRRHIIFDRTYRPYPERRMNRQ